MSEDPLLNAEKIFREKIEAVYVYKSQGKKHPTLTITQAVIEFANACKVNDKALSEISSYMKFRSKDLISEGKISPESIDKALGPEFKNHNLARIAKSGNETSGLESGNTAGSSGYTNTGNLIGSIGQSGLEELYSTPVNSLEGLATTKEEAGSSAEIMTNNSSIVYTSNSNESYAPESPNTSPIIRVIPGTSASPSSGTAITSIGGVVTIVTGTVFLTGNEVFIADNPQVLLLSGSCRDGSGYYVKPARDNNASISDLGPIILDIIGPVKQFLPEIANKIVYGPSPLQRTSLDYSGNPVSNVATIFEPPKDTERRSGIFLGLL